MITGEADCNEHITRGRRIRGVEIGVLLGVDYTTVSRVGKKADIMEYL